MRKDMAKIFADNHSAFFKDPPEFPPHVYRFDAKKVITNGVPIVSVIDVNLIEERIISR